MKLATFEVSTSVGALKRVGAVVEGQMIDLQMAYCRYLADRRGVYRAQEVAKAIIPDDMLGFIENGIVAREAAELAIDYVKETGHEVGANGERVSYPSDTVRLRAPLTRPTSLRDTLNFEVHMNNALKALNLAIPKLWYELPTFYRTTNTSVAGPDDPILWPSFTDKLDYELEFACCIGKAGKNISKEKAEEHIFGYTIFNDISARDILPKEMSLWTGPAKGKNFLNGNIIGPYLVTADEVDAYNLKMEARVNGEVWSQGSSKDMHFKFTEFIEYISKDEMMLPGELIGSGTVGFGCGLELDRWIQPGDVIELEVEGLGILRNRVQARG